MNSASRNPNFDVAQKNVHDIAELTHDARSELMMQLLFETPEDQAEQIIRKAVVDFGGTLMEPCRRQSDDSSISSWGPHDYQLSLLDCSGTGNTFAELAADWAKAAWRMMPAGPEVAA